MAWSRAEGGGIKREGILPYDVEAAIRIAGEFFQQWPCALVDFNSVDTVCGRVDEGAGEATGAGADFDNAAACEVTTEGGNPGAEARIKKEVLSKGFFGIKPVLLDAVLKGRKGHDI
ncbi:hypothetical protein AA106556_0569 [Neokomagataea tanensis NBRC 106556]|uniref:Uncharacterized protein n=1 Tax=Neokomagataea tanensis NBRC 106556 TaxID=1223519 RepID=A0ABQ0QHD3_9PROT|nr:hypothetical protein AA106556_0569 [Neokomagataea tanensis NBRC 106556]